MGVSVTAVADLAESLSFTGQYDKVVDAFRMAIKNRLLHTGASTIDIVSQVCSGCGLVDLTRLQYISVVKVALKLDPSSTSLPKIVNPIQTYLRGRRDTLRCVIDGLVGDPDSELYAELHQNTHAQSGTGAPEEALGDDPSSAVDEDSFTGDGGREAFLSSASFCVADPALIEWALKWRPPASRSGPEGSSSRADTLVRLFAVRPGCSPAAGPDTVACRNFRKY